MINPNMIVVAGYPKSGTTWLSKLVAQLLDCPVAGYFNSTERMDHAKEGEDRQSEFFVVKTHIPFDSIIKDAEKRKIIYIIRDIRDVVISGSRHFMFLPKKRTIMVSFMSKIKQSSRIGRMLARLYKRVYWNRPKKRLQTMIDVAIDGSTNINALLVPWDKHIQSYVDNGVFYLRYEDLLSNPEKISKAILNHLAIISVDDDYIRQAIHQQSFGVVKSKFEKMGDRKRSRFLRKGKSGQWRKHLSPDQKNSLHDKFKDTLERLNYESE